MDFPQLIIFHNDLKQAMTAEQREHVSLHGLVGDVIKVW